MKLGRIEFGIHYKTDNRCVLSVLNKETLAVANIVIGNKEDCQRLSNFLLKGDGIFTPTEDLRAWLKGATPLLKPHKKEEYEKLSSQEKMAYVRGYNQRSDQLLAELADTGYQGEKMPSAEVGSTPFSSASGRKEAGK